MTRSLVDRCHEVKEFMSYKRGERLLHAQSLLQSRGKEKLEHAIPFLKTELQMHQEARTLWPYLLAIADSDEAQYFCEMYNCQIDDFGKRVQTKINEMTRFLDVIENKLHKTYPPGSFWVAIREELIAKICREARKVVDGER